MCRARRWWPRYEARIRESAGLGVAPQYADPDRYDKLYAHCDVLVVGAGPAGLAAAYAAGVSGARVMLVDDRAEVGGSLLTSKAYIDTQDGADWAAQIASALRAMPEVQLLLRSTAFGYQDHNLVTVCERRTEHLPLAQRAGVRERIWKVRARRVVLATGAHERPMVFGNNDLPGIMQAASVSAYVRHYAVLPGRRVVVFTNNDSAYQTAIDLHAAGAQVSVVDARPASDGSLPHAAARLGIRVRHSTVVLQAQGRQRVTQLVLTATASASSKAATETLACDLVAMSGGWNPVLHLFAQSGGRVQWNPALACFVPGRSAQAECSAGAARGEFDLSAALRDGAQAGNRAAELTGFNPPALPVWAVQPLPTEPLMPLWQVGGRTWAERGPKQFVDMQNDVTAADIYQAVREGYHAVEHVKRYTAMGFGTDQGKLGNINGMAILAEALGQSIEQTGTTTYRPNYTPVSFGAVAGPELGEFFDPVRKTCIHAWHVEHGALFEDVGNWKRPWYYPKAGEDMHAAVARECCAVRQQVGLLDASTLGKIDIQGPDAVTLLNWIYTNAWGKLDVGKARYGLMLDENGMVFDDGVTVRLGPEHFLMSTTTGGAARVLHWMERWLQTEWPTLKVHLTSVTDHFATFAVVGPRARQVLRLVCDDIDFSNAAFPFMSFREGTVLGVAARIMRISFSGELSFEVNVPANQGRQVWDALLAAGEAHGITPYGTEAMHVLRAEKGYIIVGQDTDGSVTPHDLGMGGLLSKNKDFLGKRSLARTHTSAPGRKQFVGLLSQDPECVLPEGSQILHEASDAAMAPMLGHVTSSYLSPTLNRSIALALLKGGLERMGETVVVPLPSGEFMQASVVSPVFYDPHGVRQDVE